MQGSICNTATTPLDAINTMLSTIGEAPVNTLQGALSADVSIALNTLTETLREIQLEGWHFNTEDNYPLTPGQDQQIHLPADVFRVSLTYPDGKDVIQRGNKLYDRANHTFVFTETIEATVATLLSFEETPEAFRRYVTVKAARKFQDRVVGSGELHGFTQEDEMYARVLADREDMELSRPSLAKGDAATFISGWTVGQTLRR